MRSLVARVTGHSAGCLLEGASPGFAACFPCSLALRAVASVPSRGAAAAGGGGRGGSSGRRWAGGRWARPVGIPGPTSSCRERPTQLEEAAAAAATMSAGDTVCTGWLVKSPPERKLQRYVSRGAARPPLRPRVPARGVASRSPGAQGAPNAAAPSSRGCRQGQSTESEIARRASVAAEPSSGQGPGGPSPQLTLAEEGRLGLKPGRRCRCRSGEGDISRERPVPVSGEGWPRVPLPSEGDGAGGRERHGGTGPAVPLGPLRSARSRSCHRTLLSGTFHGV